jgi:hypothetical protein
MTRLWVAGNGRPLVLEKAGSRLLAQLFAEPRM